MHDQQHPTLIPLFDELAGERVRLRPYQATDSPAFWSAVHESRDRLVVWDSWPLRCHTLAEAQKMVAYFRADFILRREMEVGIWEKITAGFLGSIMLRPLDWQILSFEIGYWLRTSAEGQGYMHEALSLVVDYALRQLGAKRVMMRIDERNQRSLAVADRLGFVWEGRLRQSEPASDGSLRTIIVVALTPSDPLTGKP